MSKGFIIRLVAGTYQVFSNGKTYRCKARGKFRNEKITPLVGDNVEFDILDNDEGYIKEIIERKNTLIRPAIANIDQALIIMSLVEPDLSRGLLDRFLTMIEDASITPIICLSKLDKTQLNPKIKEFIKDYQNLGYKVITYSAKNPLDPGLNEIKKIIKDKKSVLTGQSGVGKSTLINALFPNEDVKEGEYSKALGRGKHTTRETGLYFTNDGWLADTPGFSSLELKMTATRLASIFPGYKNYFNKCKFRGCLHQDEIGCYIKELVAKNILNKESYNNYLSFQKELKSLKKVYNKKR